MKKFESLKLFFSLERYAFLILAIEIVCGIIEYFNLKYVPYPYSHIYLVPHLSAGLFFFNKMIGLFFLWPRKKRFHLATIEHYKKLKERNRPIYRARISSMNTPCEKITRNEVYSIIGD